MSARGHLFVISAPSGAGIFVRANCTVTMTGTTVSNNVINAAFGNELFVGIRHTREFGPIISAGLGGVEMEILARQTRKGAAVAIAPTGTIGLVMDCDTTGIEPDFALVKFKKLAGGGYFKIVNQSLRPALADVPTIVSAHPSPMSADRGFFGSRPFSRANAYLDELGDGPVDWRLG